MKTSTKIVSAIVAIVLVIIVTLVVSGGKSVKNIGSQVQNDLFNFTGGIDVGSSNQLTIDASGNIVTSGTATFTGFGKFGNAASSTVQIGAASKAGCLILGDSADGASAVYITATGATITATTTKPAACQAVQ